MPNVGLCPHPDDMSTNDAMGTRRVWRQTGLWRTRWPVMGVLLAAVLTGCSGGEARPRNASPGPASPTHDRAVAHPPVEGRGADKPLSQHRLDELAGFLDKAKFLDRIGPEFELRDVQYTSPTDAVAMFLDQRPASDDWGSVIATTHDNWAHASRLLISHDLADIVYYVPLGQGAVAIKAEDQSPRKSYPPFVLYPDRTVKPLRVTQPQALDADTELLEFPHNDFFYAIGTPEESKGLWGADVDAGEIFPIDGSPSGRGLQHAPGRDGAVFSVAGYEQDVGDGVWRFQTSIDNGQTWRQTDVSLPLGRQRTWGYAGISAHAIGPGHLQAIAFAHAPEDMPLYMSELWLTDDEKEFRRVPLPWARMAFGGMAFASDGALLLAEVQGPHTYCDALVCNRAGRIWRLAPGGTELEPLCDAPTLFGPFWAVGIRFTDGPIIARTGLRTIALSDDGYTWTEVTPG